jgi:hypothetical protein
MGMTLCVIREIGNIMLSRFQSVFERLRYILKEFTKGSLSRGMRLSFRRI